MAPVTPHKSFSVIVVTLVGVFALALAGCAGATPAAAPSATPSAAATVNVHVDAKFGTILTDSQGLTLYKYAKDGANTSECLDACAKAWPPLVAEGTPTLPSGVPGTIAAFTRTDGMMQVSFNSVPLYRYAKDQKAGDTTGDGVGGVWSVANVASTRAAPVATTPPATRLNGAIQTVANGKVTLADGSAFTIGTSTQITRRENAAASDLKAGDYVAITAKRQPDNTLLASMVNVFPPAAKGVANGQFPMTGGNLMTNATIDKVTTGGFTVTFPGGGANITLASNATITRVVAADQSALTTGTMIMASVRNGVAQSITVQ